MVKRIGTARRKTKHKSRQTFRTKGKIPFGRYFQKFDVGDRVALVANPAVCKGMYFPRFHGKIGTVLSQQGFCYQVALKEGSLKKIFNIHPVHLKKVQ